MHQGHTLWLTFPFYIKSQLQPQFLPYNKFLKLGYVKNTNKHRFLKYKEKQIKICKFIQKSPLLSFFQMSRILGIDLCQPQRLPNMENINPGYTKNSSGII